MPINSISHMANFKSEIDKDGGPANPSRFIFALGGYPAVLRNQPKYRATSVSFLRSLQFMCEATDLPGLTVHTNERVGYSPITTTHMPGKFDYQTLNLTIICRDYMREKELFDDWMLSIRNMHETTNFSAPGPTYDTAYYNNLIVDGNLFLLSNNGDASQPATDVEQTRYAVRMRGLYPTSMDSIQLAWAEDSLMRLQVTFTYYAWFPIIGASQYAHQVAGQSTAKDPLPTISVQSSQRSVVPRTPTPILRF